MLLEVDVVVVMVWADTIMKILIMEDDDWPIFSFSDYLNDFTVQTRQMDSRLRCYYFLVHDEYCARDLSSLNATGIATPFGTSSAVEIILRDRLFLQH